MPVALENTLVTRVVPLSVRAEAGSVAGEGQHVYTSYSQDAISAAGEAIDRNSTCLIVLIRPVAEKSSAKRT